MRTPAPPYPNYRSVLGVENGEGAGYLGDELMDAKLGADKTGEVK